MAAAVPLLTKQELRQWVQEAIEAQFSRHKESNSYKTVQRAVEGVLQGIPASLSHDAAQKLIEDLSARVTQLQAQKGRERIYLDEAPAASALRGIDTVRERVIAHYEPRPDWKAGVENALRAALGDRPKSLVTLLRTLERVDSIAEFQAKLRELRAAKEQGLPPPFLDQDAFDKAMRALPREREAALPAHDASAWANTYRAHLARWAQGGREEVGRMNGPILVGTLEASKQFPAPEVEVVREVPPLDPPARREATRIEFRNVSTFQAARQLVGEGLKPLVLDMANAVDVGGAPERANAQEETLCRQSNLLTALKQVSHGQRKYPADISSLLQREGALYVKGAHFFRNDPSEGYDFVEPFPASFVVSAAYNCNRAHGPGYDRPDNDEAYLDGMKQKIITQMRIARQKGHDSLVLSAFGCGAFKNDPEVVAGIYKELLRKNPEFTDVFKKVVFGIIDMGTDNLNVFERAFNP